MRKLGIALGGCDQATFDMHLQAGINLVWRCTSSQRACGLKDALVDRHCVNLAMHYNGMID